MSSTNKCPSGLSHWLDSDKPERLDFVTDNELIDQNALWKADYDADGVVAQTGGINAYAMAKTDYDPAGNVAAAGGIANAIQTAVSANEGYTTYVHSKNGTVHSLSNANGGDVIRFITTADFKEGDKFIVNGTVCTAKTTDGELLQSGYFVQGAVVTCCKNGTILNFKSGGEGLNYKVVVAESVSAMNAIESPQPNTIAVISSMPLPVAGNRYVIAHGEAIGMLTVIDIGGVWIKTNAAATYSFDALKKNSILINPVSVLQRTDAAYNYTMREAFIYVAGTGWVQFSPRYLWNNKSVGFTVTSNASTSASNTAAGAFFATTTNSSGGSAYAYVTADLTGFNTLAMRGDFASQAYSLYGIGAFSSIGFGSDVVPVVGRSGSGLGYVTNTLYTFDISQLRGSFFIGGKIYSGSSIEAWATTSFSQIYLY